MIWLFVILGAVGLASSLQGAIGGLLVRRLMPASIVSSLLFVAAWVLGHSGWYGWVALCGGLLIEALRRLGGAGGEQKAAGQSLGAEDSNPAPAFEAPGARLVAVEDESGGGAAEAGATSSVAAGGSAPPALTSVALLSNSWQLAPGVLVASLRRCGERMAKLDQQPTGSAAARISVGPVVFEFEYMSGPLPRAVIEEAAAQSWDWTEAQAGAEKHAARIRITSRVAAYRDAGESSREAALRLHCRTHQALAEFAPVVAILWPEGGRLLAPVRAGLLASEKRGFGLAAATAVNFRTFPPESGSGEFVCDSIGLDSLGLVDVQVRTAAEPDESISRDVYALAQWQFERGCLPAADMTWPQDNTRWRICPASSVFGRSRPVMELEAPATEDGAEAAAMPEE